MLLLFGGITDFSTNGSILPDFRRLNYNAIGGIIISIPGFSQASYDKVHGFKFMDIIENIIQYAKHFRHIHNKSILINYHVYQFNIHELDAAKQFAEKLGVRLCPSYAFFNNSKLGINYLKNRLNEKDLYDASRQLLLHYVDELLLSHPKEYKCPQLSYLTLDEFGSVLLCCAMARTQQNYSIGSVFDLTLEQIGKLRKEHNACTPCMESGFAYWVHNSPHWGVEDKTK